MPPPLSNTPLDLNPCTTKNFLPSLTKLFFFLFHALLFASCNCLHYLSSMGKKWFNKNLGFGWLRPLVAGGLATMWFLPRTANDPEMIKMNSPSIICHVRYSTVFLKMLSVNALYVPALSSSSDPDPSHVFTPKISPTSLHPRKKPLPTNLYSQPIT